MGPFLLAVVVALGLGVGASVVLEKFQKTADKAYVGTGARPDHDPKLDGVKPKG
jgi:hypothetical protein